MERHGEREERPLMIGDSGHTKVAKNISDGQPLVITRVVRPAQEIFREESSQFGLKRLGERIGRSWGADVTRWRQRLYLGWAVL